MGEANVQYLVTGGRIYADVNDLIAALRARGHDAAADEAERFAELCQADIDAGNLRRLA